MSSKKIPNHKSDELVITRIGGAKEHLSTRGMQGIQPIGAKDAESDDILLARIDSQENTLRVGLYVWDEKQRIWTKMQQPMLDIKTNDLTVLKDESEKVALELWDYQEENGIIFYGTHTKHDASEDETNWKIRKATLEASIMVRRETIIGSWNSRESLPWAK